MWSDNEAETDLLQFSYLANAVARLARTPHLLPTTIGIFGDWGSGKSTLLKLIHAILHKDSDTLCISFNGWLFEGYEDAKTALMGTILDDLQERIAADQTLLEKCQGLLSKLVKRVNWLQLASMAGRYAIPALLGLPQLSLAQVGSDLHRAAAALPGALSQQAKNLDVEQAKQLLKDVPDGPENVRRNIRDFRADFARLLAEAGIKQLVVFIDDLDRCFPESIIETLEAIKLFLFVPGTAFIIGADERLVQYAVRQRFPELPGPEAEVGRDYLEKLIQIPVRIPPLPAAELESYLNLLFTEQFLFSTESTMARERLYAFLAQAPSRAEPERLFSLERARALFEGNQVPNAFEADLNLVAQIAPILAPGLGGNPRRTKRFLNTLMLRMEISEDRGFSLKRRVLAKLMLVEYLKPEFFRQLAQLQAQQEGKPEELLVLEKRLRATRHPQIDVQAPTDRIDAEGGTAPLTTSPGEKPRITNTDGKTSAKGQVPPRTAEASDTEEALSSAAVVWLADGWMQDWLRSEPSLVDVDLRPYFFIAHDRVGAIESIQTRLSPAATEVLRALLDGKPVTQTIGLRQADHLSAADATALFESLASRIRQAEVLDASSPYEVIFKLVEHRSDLQPQLIAMIGSLSEAKLPPSAPANLLRVTRNTPLEAVGRTVIQRWANGSNKRLANAAQLILKR